MQYITVDYDNDHASQHHIKGQLMQSCKLSHKLLEIPKFSSSTCTRLMPLNNEPWNTISKHGQSLSGLVHIGLLSIPPLSTQIPFLITGSLLHEMFQLWTNKCSYYYSANFWGRKLSWISRFASHPQKFPPRNFMHTTPTYTIDLVLHESFLRGIFTSTFPWMFSPSKFSRYTVPFLMLHPSFPMTWECSEKGMSILRVTRVALASRSAKISSLAFWTAEGLPITFTWGSVGEKERRGGEEREKERMSLPHWGRVHTLFCGKGLNMLD